MARQTLAERRRQLSINPAEAEEADQSAQFDPSAPVDLSLPDDSAFYAEVGTAPADSVVHVSKIEEGKDVKIWRGAPSAFDMEKLVRTFGSGDYRMMLYGKTDTGQIVRRHSQVQSYKLPPEDDARIAAMREGRGGVQPWSLDMLTAAIKAAMPPQPVHVAPANQLGLIKEVGEIVRSMMPAAPAAASPGIGVADLIPVLVAALKDRRGEDDDAPARGEAGAYDLLMKLIDKFSDPLKAAMQGQAPGQPAALPAPAGTAAQSPPAQAPAQQGDDEMMGLKMGLTFLCAQAARGSDAELYADVIIDNVDEEELRKLVGNPAWIDSLAVFNPDVKKYAKWFGALKDAVLAELEAPGDNEGEPAA
jgi:hypothetical protein